MRTWGMFVSTRRVLFFVLFVLNFVLPPCPLCYGQQTGSHWNISPQGINITVGSERRLQALDSIAQEQHGLIWAVDDPELAEIYENNGIAVLTAKAVGTVRVTASLGGETHSLDVKIWPLMLRLPGGTTNWGTGPIGRDVGDLPAVPTPGGPNIYSLEQAPEGSTYLRAFASDGIQTWTWLMPEQTHNVELICGDWLGGAVISADRDDSYTLYVVGKDGKLRWKHTSEGVRNSLAIGTDHLLYLMTQSQGKTSANLNIFDEADGTAKFQFAVPPSFEKQTGVIRNGSNFICSDSANSAALPIAVTRVIVNMDGYAYIAFTRRARSLAVSSCKTGTAVASSKLKRTREDRLILWQIRQDGSHRESEVETVREDQEIAKADDEIFPTRAIVTDNMNGILIPVRVSHSSGALPDDYVYRISDQGELLYKFPLPKYSTGSLHDEMVIGTDNTGFATRGATLVAFSIKTGRELWRWNSQSTDITVFAALADGSCDVQTPTELVDVQEGGEARVVMQGKAMLDWQGQMFRKDQ